MLQCAVKNGTLARNVAAVHAPPKVEEDEIEILSAEQIADVLAKLEGHTLYPIVRWLLPLACAAASCWACSGMI